MMSDPNFEVVRAFAAEGARVGLTICRRCGAAVLLDPATSFDVIEVHTAWHEGEEQDRD